jgi:hypothetical protein
LWIRFRRVEGKRRGDYLEALAARAGSAEREGVRAWVFEADDEDGLFVEFLEAPGDIELAALDARTEEALVAAAGNPSTEDFRCSEIPQG